MEERRFPHSYTVNRYYDPTTAQFLSVDPDVAETGQPYAFTGNDPLNQTDPLGLRWRPARRAPAPRTYRRGATSAAVIASAGIGVALKKYGTQVKGGVRGGGFPDTARPNQILYRANEKGITSYQVFSAKGNPTMRVDLQGASHGGVDTPHVHDFTANTNPETGQTFYSESKTPRPATASEIPTPGEESALLGSGYSPPPETGWDGLRHDLANSWDDWNDNGGPADGGEDG